MIKFFRRIRQNLLSEGKTSKYFKYAIGEILLVVIGILIAVGINSKYSNSQNEKKIQTILKQVQNELVTDIKDAHRIFGRYIEADSLSLNILNDSITTETFMANRLTVFYRNRYVSFSNKKTGYERLFQNLENLPQKYTELLPVFNDLFREQQNEIDDYNEQIKKSVLENGDRALRTKPWIFDVIMGNLSKEDAKRILEDPFLKNQTIRYINDLGNISQAANNYRATSIKLYKKIDSLLGSQPTEYQDLLQTTPKKEAITPYLGEYSLIRSTNNNFKKITIQIVNGQLILKSNPTEQEFQLFWDSEDYYFNPESDNIFHFYKNKKGECFLKISDGIRVSLYIKTE